MRHDSVGVQLSEPGRAGKNAARRALLALVRLQDPLRAEHNHAEEVRLIVHHHSETLGAWNLNHQHHRLQLTVWFPDGRRHPERSQHGPPY